MADTSIRSGLTTIHTALENLVKNPTRLEIERSRFDRDVSYVSHQSHNSTASLSPESPSTMYQRERLERRDREKWQLMKVHDASRANRQFDAQVYELEARIIEGIENRTLDVPDGTNMNNLANETVKKNWIKQRIWNEGWEHIPQPWWMWKHEEPPEVTPAPEIDLNRLSQLRGEELTTAGFLDKRVPQSGERKAKQKPGDESSRPFHQFIYQISKERERIQSKPDFPDGASSTSVNTEAYEHVKSIWVERGIWNNQWGILPGMAWKHESPFQMPDNDRDLSPSPTVPSEHVTFNLQPRLPLFDRPFPAQADVPDQADGPASNGGQITTNRKRAAAPAGPKKARRKVSRTVKPETSDSRPTVHNSISKSVPPDQGTQDTGRRRSKRIQNRNKSN